MSAWDCTLKQVPSQQTPKCAGVAQVSGMAEADAERVVKARAVGAFESVADVGNRARLSKRSLDLLAEAGALESLAGHRHAARWVAAGVAAGWTRCWNHRNRRKSQPRCRHPPRARR